ncbi:MAG: MGMT family protein [Gemmatimonadetes bacterium]|nr:MGMT family protein [Gemmatimonadota bacterium]
MCWGLPSHTKVTWHRVINAKGEVSLRSTPGAEGEQRHLLECEGISFDARGRIDLEETRWRRADHSLRRFSTAIN